MYILCTHSHIHIYALTTARTTVSSIPIPIYLSHSLHTEAKFRKQQKQGVQAVTEQLLVEFPATIIDPNEVTLFERLGAGDWASVYRGLLGAEQVAVKSFNFITISEKIIRTFHDEVS